MKKSIRPSLALMAISLSMLAGCASFPADTLQNVRIPSVKSERKPSAYVEIKFFSGKPDNPQAAEVPAFKSKLQPMVEKVTRESGIFSYVSFDAFEQAKMDNTIKLYFYNHGEAGAAMVMGMLCGFTLGIIPAAATDHYTLVTQVGSSGRAAPATFRSDDAITTWLGIWFLPLAGKTPEKAMNLTVEELVRDSLRQLVEQRQLRFTQYPLRLPKG